MNLIEWVLIIIIVIGGLIWGLPHLSLWYAKHVVKRARRRKQAKTKPQSTPAVESKPTPKSTTSTIDQVDTTVLSVDKFQAMFHSQQAFVKPGSLVLAEITDHRVYGAMIDLTPAILRHRMDLVNHGIVQRNPALRRAAVVPGYDSVKNEWLHDKPLWHRTHLIPFRMALSEGNDHPGLLMTATAYLNMGQRVQSNYFVDSDEQDYREHHLYQMYAQHWSLSLTTPTQIIADQQSGMHYSLDDIERLVTHIILSHKKDNGSFRYQVQPLYAEHNPSVLAKAVWVQLIDQTHHRTLVNVILPNVR